MSNGATRKAVRRRSRFVPDVSTLESRRLLSSVAASHGAHPDVVLRIGRAVQNGTILSVTVDKPTTNTVQVTNEGAGNIQVDWNGGAVHSFSGVGTIHVYAQKARNDLITFKLTDPVNDSLDAQKCVRTLPAAVSGLPLARPDLIFGTAVQSGSTLTITVAKSTTNTVRITALGNGAVQAAWNGGVAHSFSGVEAVVVHAEKATNNDVSLGWAST